MPLHDRHRMSIRTPPARHGRNTAKPESDVNEVMFFKKMGIGLPGERDKTLINNDLLSFRAFDE